MTSPRASQGGARCVDFDQVRAVGMLSASNPSMAKTDNAQRLGERHMTAS